MKKKKNRGGNGGVVWDSDQKEQYTIIDIL
jgi:hypothetical protein